MSITGQILFLRPYYLNGEEEKVCKENTLPTIVRNLWVPFMRAEYKTLPRRYTTVSGADTVKKIIHNKKGFDYLLYIEIRFLTSKTVYTEFVPGFFKRISIYIYLRGEAPVWT